MFSNEQIDIDVLPDFTQVDYKKMDKNAPFEQLIGWGITFAIVYTPKWVIFINLTDLIPKANFHTQQL